MVRFMSRVWIGVGIMAGLIGTWANLPVGETSQPMRVYAQEETVPRFEPDDCPFYPYEQAVECGYLVVPEDRTNPDSPTIRIAVAIFQSSARRPLADPLIYLDGGPGIYTLDQLGDSASWVFEEYLETRDVILFDQRGTGYSYPSLNCQELDATQRNSLTESSVEAMRLKNEALLECRTRLAASGINLDAYNSRENAADVRDLALALGYEEWNLLGGSYGSRLALTIMRDQPDGVRSVILDSVYPPQVQAYYFTNAENLERVLELVFAACAADPDCDAVYPNLRSIFFKVIELHTLEPQTLEIYDWDRNESLEILLDGERLLDILRGLFYNVDAIPYIPQMIYELRYNNYETFEALARGFLYVYDGFSEGLHYAIECGEDVPFVTETILDELEGNADPRLWTGVVEIWNLQALCEDWTSLTPADMENEAVTSQIPTLVLSGEYDPVTPPAWGELVTETLPNSYFFEFEGMSHGVVVWNRCAVRMTIEFLDDPYNIPDNRCMRWQDSLKFIIE